MRALVAIAGFVVVALVAGCSGENSATRKSGPSPSAGSSGSTPGSGAQLTGFGATVKAWEGEHGGSVPGYAKGSVYGPVVRGNTHEYFAVGTDEVTKNAEPRVLMYTREFPPHTDLDTAEALILEDFPADAKIAADSSNRACVMQLIRSKTLRKAIKADAIVAFYSVDELPPLDKSDVAEAIVMGSHGFDEQNLRRC